MNNSNFLAQGHHPRSLATEGGGFWDFSPTAKKSSNLIPNYLRYQNSNYRVRNISSLGDGNRFGNVNENGRHDAAASNSSRKDVSSFAVQTDLNEGSGNGAVDCKPVCEKGIIGNCVSGVPNAFDETVEKDVKRDIDRTVKTEPLDDNCREENLPENIKEFQENMER